MRVHSRLREWRGLLPRAYSQDDSDRVWITDLAPTQMTVGMREVSHKRRRWRERSPDEATDFLGKLRVPVVLGPGARPYLLDRHHMALALHHEGVKKLLVSVTADLSHLTRNEFWTNLESQSWAHPFNASGHLCPYDEVPDRLDGLQDDPFRSLSWAVKKAGGYAKVGTPFSEFRWAEFFRSRIPRELIELEYVHAQALAIHFARSAEAAALPGWLPPADAMIAVHGSSTTRARLSTVSGVGCA